MQKQAVVVVLVADPTLHIIAVVSTLVVVLHEQKLRALYEMMRPFVQPDVECHILVAIVLISQIER